MDDLAFVLREMLGVADDAVVKTGAHGQQHIAVLHGVVGFHRAVHAQHAQELAVARRVGAQAHQGVGAGVTQHVHQGAQLGRRVAQKHAAAGVNIGTLGREQQLQRLADLAAVALAHRVVRAHFHTGGVTGVGHFFEGHVFRNVHHHRAGAAAAGDVEGLFHGLGQVARVLDQKVVLDDRARDTHGVALLKSV